MKRSNIYFQNAFCFVVVVVSLVSFFLESFIQLSESAVRRGLKCLPSCFQINTGYLGLQAPDLATRSYTVGVFLHLVGWVKIKYLHLVNVEEHTSPGQGLITILH